MANVNFEPELTGTNDLLIDQSLTENVSLKCPKCQEIFTINDFENSELSKAHYQHFVQKLTEHAKKQIEVATEKKLSEKFQSDLNIKINENKLINAQQLNDKIKELNTEKENLVSKFNADLMKERTVNQELKTEINSLELVKNKEILEQLNGKIKEFNIEKEKLAIKFNADLMKERTVIQDLKAKIDNLELVKSKEVAQQLNDKIKEFSMEKEKLIYNFNDRLAKERTANQDLKAVIDNLELTKGKELAEQLNNKIKEFNTEKEKLVIKFNDELKQKTEEIHKLELDNEKMKLINNKVQGDNLEQEIEEILSRTFLLDSISKITAMGKKADLTQKVKLDGTDNHIATITYEIKSTKDWSEGWEAKLSDDMRRTNARYGIITATAFPVKYGKKIFAISDFNPNIYLCSHENVALVAQIVRMFILTEYRLENTNKSNSELEKKVSKLAEWKKVDFPHVSLKIKKAIDALEKVKIAIANQLPPLEKNINVIKDNFLNEIEQSLNLLIV